MQNSIKHKLNSILSDILKINSTPEEVTTENTSSWDSLNHLNLIVSLEEEFEIDISVEEIARLYKDYSTILAFIMQKFGN